MIAKVIFVFVGTALLMPYALSAQAISDEAVQRSNEGVELLKQGKFSEAIGPLLKAVELNPKDSNLRLNLAYAYDRQGRLEEAVIHYQKAIELNPRDSIARNNLGILYSKAGRYDEAIRELEKALEIDPKSATAPKNLETAKKNQAAVQEREKTIAEAVKNVESNPENAKAHYSLARVYAFYGKKALAIASLEEALKFGYGDIDYVKIDTALDSIRNEPDYVWLLRGR